jgi:ADP-heptose:LPS heptosyltransferase
LLAQRGATVILEAPRPLVDLLGKIPGVSRVITAADPRPDFDLWCPLMSLPLAFGTTMDTIPAAERYIWPDPVRVQEWRTKVDGAALPRVGIAWAAKRESAYGRARSAPLEEIAAVALEAGSVFSLHHAVSEDDARVLQRIPTIRHFGAELTDFMDNAALIEAMDVVITVDTSIAHLAAAMGKPTWVLLAAGATDWRWFTGRDDSPWYPTVRLFRQEKPGDWASVIQRVRAALAQREGDNFGRDGF